MTPSEKFKVDKHVLKEQRVNRIMAAAFDLFSKKGIDTIAMTDIAEKAEIGVASLYRYYTSKEKMVINTVIWAWNQQKSMLIPYLEKKDFEEKNGLEQLDYILSLFVTLFENNTDFLRFIYFFDSYAVRVDLSKETLEDYEDVIKSVEAIFLSAINKGIMDKSIDQKYKGKESDLYFALTHALFNTAQKLSLSGNLLKMDSLVNGKIELSLIIDMLIKGISA